MTCHCGRTAELHQHYSWREHCGLCECKDFRWLRRSLLQWWLRHQRCRRWRNGPARKPTGKELAELKERLHAFNEARSEKPPESAVPPVQSPPRRPSDLEAAGGDVEEYLIWLEQRWERR